MATNVVAQQVAAPTADEVVESGVLWAPVSSRLLVSGERRLEASTFLTDGFGLRQGLEAVASTQRVGEVARVWQPSRLKGYTVGEGSGLPFLSAGQVFESQPRVRKWLAEAMVPAVETRYLDPSWLLLSCSGEVGRVTAVYQEHLDRVITHDLLRVVPNEDLEYGWLYAYMKTPTFFAIARSAQYGHMIKHLEPEHVLMMPVAMPDAGTRQMIGERARRALSKRREARSLQDQADELYGGAINPDGAVTTSTSYSVVRSSELWSGRRRMEGQFHRSDVRQIESMVRRAGPVARLADVVTSISMAPRFKRYFGWNGTPYRSASELFDVNPRVTKRIYAALLDNPEQYMLNAGEMIMARSGQTYGLLGRTMTLSSNHAGTFGSEDLIRIRPDETKALSGYLQTAINHVHYGRPRVVRFASGTSVPHLDPPDIRELPIPRLDVSMEREIAELSSQATELSAEADRLETDAVEEAERVVESLTGRHGRAVALDAGTD